MSTRVTIPAGSNSTGPGTGLTINTSSPVSGHLYTELPRLAAFVRARDCFSRFAVGRAAAFGLALVPQLLAFGEREFDFHPAIFEVQAGGNQSQSLLLGLADKLPNFLLMDQQLAGAQRRMIEDVAMVVGADVAVQQP